MYERNLYELTNAGLDKVNAFIRKCEAKRKEILDAGKDTAYETTIPSVDDIISDINYGEGVDEDGDYYNMWGVTDNYNSDYPCALTESTDFVDANITVRPLSQKDTNIVSVMDEDSGFCVSQWLDDNDNTDYAWGIFKDSILIGYCTTGYADDCGDIIEEDIEHTADSILLSDVYIRPEYRHKGYGRELVVNAIKNRWESDGCTNTVYLQYINDYVARWYESMGFAVLPDNCMKLTEKCLK